MDIVSRGNSKDSFYSSRGRLIPTGETGLTECIQEITASVHAHLGTKLKIQPRPHAW